MAEPGAEAEVIDLDDLPDNSEHNGTDRKSQVNRARQIQMAITTIRKRVWALVYDPNNPGLEPSAAVVVTLTDRLETSFKLLLEELAEADEEFDQSQPAATSATGQQATTSQSTETVNDQYMDDIKLEMNYDDAPPMASHQFFNRKRKRTKRSEPVEDAPLQVRHLRGRALVDKVIHDVLAPGMLERFQELVRESRAAASPDHLKQQADTRLTTHDGVNVGLAKIRYRILYNQSNKLGRVLKAYALASLAQEGDLNRSADKSGYNEKFISKYMELLDMDYSRLKSDLLRGRAWLALSSNGFEGLLPWLMLIGGARGGGVLLTQIYSLGSNSSCIDFLRQGLEYHHEKLAILCAAGRAFEQAIDGIFDTEFAWERQRLPEQDFGRVLPAPYLDVNTHPKYQVSPLRCEVGGCAWCTKTRGCACGVPTDMLPRIREYKGGRKGLQACSSDTGSIRYRKGDLIGCLTGEISQSQQKKGVNAHFRIDGLK